MSDEKTTPETDPYNGELPNDADLGADANGELDETESSDEQKDDIVEDVLAPHATAAKADGSAPAA